MFFILGCRSKYCHVCFDIRCGDEVWICFITHFHAVMKHGSVLLHIFTVISKQIQDDLHAMVDLPLRLCNTPSPTDLCLFAPLT